jgi:galactokinase
MLDEKRITDVTRDFITEYGQRPKIWIRAPGRIDLMGSYTDANEGLSLMLAIDREIWIAAKPRRDDVIQIYSDQPQTGGTFLLRRISHDYQVPWTNYVRGVAASLRHAGYPLRGFDGLINSNLPMGSGLGSSASLEIATGKLFQALTGARIRPLELAQMCHDAEVNFLGIECSLRDQYTVLMGKPGHALLLDSKKLTMKPVKIDPSIAIVLCDTRLQAKHLRDVQQQRHAECREGIRMLASYHPEVTSLRNVTSEMLLMHRADLDPVVAQRCRFIVEENARAPELARALTAGDQAAIHDLTVRSFDSAQEQFNIVSEEMEWMMGAILGAPGAIGGRQTGLGLGKSMVAFVEANQAELFATHVKQMYWALAHVRAEVHIVSGADAAGQFKPR